MKKILALALSIGLIVSLNGCLRPTVNTQPPETSSIATSGSESTETTAATNTETFEQLPMTAVSVPVVTQTETAADGTVLFRYTYQNMALIVPDPEIADRVIVDFLNRIDETAAHADQILDAAKSAYSGNTQWIPYLCQITYDPMRIDPGVLSLKGSYASYSGSAHPETAQVSVTYDLMTGNVLTLRDILTNDHTANSLYQPIVDALKKQQKEKSLYEGYESTVKDLINQNNSYSNNWYFSQTGLCFYFSPYEIAPYASGIIVAEIPYSQLTGILNDAYFPAEIENSAGTIAIEAFDEQDLESYTQFSEVVLDNSGNQILLHTDGSVNHIRLESGSWNADGTVFMAEHTVFATYSLTPGDAIVVEAAGTGSLPTLRLSYTVADETVSYYMDTTGDPELKMLP